MTRPLLPTLGLITRRAFAAMGLYPLATAASPWRRPWSQGQQPAAPTRPRRPTYDGPLNEILLKDFEPKSNLVVPEHHPAKPKFPVIDVHVHPRAEKPEDVKQCVQIMDEAGIERLILVTGRTGKDFDHWVDLYLKPYPTRFMLFCGIDTRNLDVQAPDYPQKVAAELERCHQMGARGVGEVTDKGRGFNASSYAETNSTPRNERLHVDDHRLDLFWEKCRELSIPVSLHIADLPGSWQPQDRHQELGADFAVYNQHGADIPSHAELISRFLTLVERHPKTTFIAVHLANLGHDLGQLGQAFDRYPNLNADISARQFEFGRQPVTASTFFRKYKDRILYGSDLTVSVRMYQLWWRLLETRDEFIDGPAWWPLYGLGLPDDTLQAIYDANAKRLLNWT